MTKIIGLDLGLSKTGIAITEGQVVRPYATVSAKSLMDLVSKIEAIQKKEGIQEIVIGELNGKNVAFQEEFKKRLKLKLGGVKITMVDETFTTRQARETMIKLQIRKKKKKEREHQIAACLILESYINRND